MTNSENSPIFIDSILKVTATEDIDIIKELAHENIQDKTIQELLEKSENDKKE
jgi:hypothetical protein